MASQRDRIRHAYRIADRRHKIFDGQGAALYGARWNSPGRRVIYAAESYAGAMLEVLASANIGAIPKRHVWIEIAIGPDISIEEVTLRNLRGWDAPDQLVSRKFGDRWYDEGRSTLLIVPSVVARLERNVLINQDHPGFRKLRSSRPRPVAWDRRLFAPST